MSMIPENATKTRRVRRTKADIEEAILTAAVEQIKKNGFALAMITDIVKSARIEPIVFYNRYKNLNEFYAEFVQSYDFWLQDLLDGSLNAMTTEAGYSNMIEKLFGKLLEDDVLTELLRWEVAEGNDITMRTAHMRERQAVEMAANFANGHGASDLDIAALTSLIVGGLYYMVLHRNRSTMIDIDINRPEDRRRVVAAIRSFASLIFRSHENRQLAGEADQSVEEYRRQFEKSCRERVESDYRALVEELIHARVAADRDRIAKNLKAEGLPDEAIARVLS